MQLTAEQQRVADRITELVTRKTKSGKRKYSKREVRDFLVAYMLEMKLEIGPEVQGQFLSLLADAGVSGNPSKEEVHAAVRAYYEKNPVNPDLRKELEALGRDEALTGAKGYKNRDEQLAALKSVGKGEKLEAPTHKPKGRKIAKVKRGIKK